MKKIIAAILIISLLWTVALAEQSFDEMDKEFDQLIDEITRLNKAEAILKNGYRTYPSVFENYDNVFDVEFDLPDELFTYTAGKKYAGSIYLVTGTVKSKENQLIWNVDVDGKLIQILASCYLDRSTSSITAKKGAYAPEVGETANFYITYWWYDFEYAYFFLDVTDTQIQDAKS